MKHTFLVAIVDDGTVQEIPVARRSTREKAETQAQAIRDAFGTFARSAPEVVVRDIRD